MAILLRLLHLAAHARSDWLLSDDAAEAAELLKESFKRWPSRHRSAKRARPTPSPDAPNDDAMKEHFRRNPEIVENCVDDELFLVNPAGEAIYHLNAVGAALWRLLGEPIRLDEAVDVLRRAFPGVPQAQIARDVGTVLADLAKRGLISGPPAPRR